VTTVPDQEHTQKPKQTPRLPQRKVIKADDPYL